MTGREKIEAAFSAAGTPQTPAVICYEGIFLRDHWEQLCADPWWFQEAPDVERQISWRSEANRKITQDWFRLPLGSSREERRCTMLQSHPEGALRTDTRTGATQLLRRPRVGGWSAVGGDHSERPLGLAATREQIEALSPLPSDADLDQLRSDGRADLAAALIERFGGELYPTWTVTSPFWYCSELWRFEDLMILMTTRPGIVEYACQRFSQSVAHAVRQAAIVGAAGVWIEECFTDLISPDLFEVINLPLVTALVEEIRLAGMKSIYYYCGNPSDRWQLLLKAGADALALEESKKDFRIDIEEVVKQVDGRCVVLGNLDAIGVLQDGTEKELRNEIARQLAAGRQNGGRFIMSLGSPVTPETPPERVRRYCELVREISSSHR